MDATVHQISFVSLFMQATSSSVLSRSNKLLRATGNCASTNSTASQRSYSATKSKYWEHNT
jgi:hypothetical protein